MEDGDERPKFPKRLYTKDEEPAAVKSIAYYSSYPRLMPALRAVMKPDEWDELASSRLGVFIRFFELNFGWASRLVHSMLGLQLECKKKYEMWCLIGSNPIRFSLNEFEHITGLNCDCRADLDVPEVEVSEGLKEFWEKLGVSIETGPSQEELTAACGYADSWSREDRMRLGYLAIYAGFIEARRPSSSTPVHHARLVMDLDTFENYPWGRLAFKNLMDSIRFKDISKTYTVRGFVEVLQVWVYHSMPDYARSFSIHIAGNPTPPLLAYGGSKYRKHVKENIVKQVRNHSSLLM